MIDNINHPKHYESGPFECILLTEQYSFNVGNMLKYVWRHRLKGHPREDLEKAIWYGRRAIDADENFRPCTRLRLSDGMCLKSDYDTATMLLVKGDSCTSKTEKAFWQCMADATRGISLDGAKATVARLEQLLKEHAK